MKVFAFVRDTMEMVTNVKTLMNVREAKISAMEMLLVLTPLAPILVLVTMDILVMVTRVKVYTVIYLNILNRHHLQKKIVL